MATARLAEIGMPDFGMPQVRPGIPATLYADRLARLRERIDERGYDLVVYADREHSANLAYLTGFDQRFEEALLVGGPTGDPAIRGGNASELPARIADYVERLMGPYFAAVAEWYEALHVGPTGGALREIIDRRLGDPLFGISLIPGHQIHLDERVNSPVTQGSTIELRSGIALQVDIIPATGTDHFTTIIEDGSALADETLRAAFGVAYPAAWEWIQARRLFMRDALVMDLHPDVPPFSNVHAYLPPSLLRPDLAMTTAA